MVYALAYKTTAFFLALGLCFFTHNAIATSSFQGVISYTPAEINAALRFKKTDNDAANAVDKIIRDADKALDIEPAPFAKGVTTGEAVKSGGKANSSEFGKQANNCYMLALANALTQKPPYAEHAKKYLLRWAQMNQPQGDSIVNTKLIPMFRAYDLLQDQFSASDRAVISHWMRGIADAVMMDQAQARVGGKNIGFNNHRSHALLVVAAIGCALNDNGYIYFVTGKEGFLAQIGSNLHDIAGEPVGLGVDYHERKAYHYVAYNLQALGQLAVVIDRLAHLPANPYGITYHPYNVEVQGASILRSMQALLPFAAGESRAVAEFEGSSNKGDLERIRNGALHTEFNRHDAVPALEAADYFTHTIKDSATGKNYNLAAIAADSIASSKGQFTQTQRYPTPVFFLNAAASPYLH